MNNVNFTINNKERTARFNAKRMQFECNVGYKDNNFKWQSRIIRGSSIDELKANIVEFENQLNNQLVNNNPTFKAFSTYYLENIAPANNDVVTIYQKRNKLRRICQSIGDVKLSELTTIQLQSLYTEMSKKYKQNTVAGYHELISVVLNCAVRMELIDKNPNKNCVVKGFCNGTKIYWSMSTCKRFIDFIKNDKKYKDLYKPILCVIFTGLRRGEILGIKKESLDLDGKFIKIEGQIKVINGKNCYSTKLKTPKSKRKVKPPEAIFDILSDFDSKNDTEFAFIHKGKCWNIRTFDDMLKRAFTDFGYPKMSIKQLRSSFVKTNIENNVPMKIIQTVLGHSKLSTTMDIYGELISEDTFKYTDNMLAMWSD